MSNKKRIPVSENVAYTHWEMPDLTGVKRRIAQRLNEFEQEEMQAEKQPVEPPPPTPEELAQLREDARQEGYAAGLAEGHTVGQEEGRALGYKAGEETGQETGFQAGYQRGLDEAEQEVDQQLARLQSIIEQLQGPLAALDQDVEAALLSLVDLVCRGILRREVKLDRSFLTEILQEAVAALPAGHQRLRIFLNPEDLNLAEAACQDLLEEYRLVGDPEVTLGGAKIETLQSLVDSTLENRYKKIIDKLLGSAYQPQLKDFKPLSDEVLSTPDTPLLDEAEFSIPTKASQEPTTELEAQADAEQEIEARDPELSVSESASLEQAEPVAQVSLQRGKAPRHQQPLEPLSEPQPETNPVTTEGLSTASEPHNEPTTASQEQPENLTAEALNEQVTEPLSEVHEEPIDEETKVDTASALEQEENTDQVDDFLDEFTESTSDLSEPTSELAAIEDSLNEEAVGQEADATETNWSPESVHDDRYLDDVLESTWLDDLQEPSEDEPLNTIKDDGQGS